MNYADTRVSRPTLTAVSACMQSSNEPYWELFVVIGLLRHLYFVHQTNHWTVSGDPFYGDHQLFQRLYAGVEENGGINDEIDSVAEKAVGLGSANLVDLASQLAFVSQLQQSFGHRPYNLPHPDKLVQLSLSAELTFLHAMEHVCQSLKSSGMMTHGLDNLLAGIEDTHESSVYLLKQRSTSVFLP